MESQHRLQCAIPPGLSTYPTFHRRTEEGTVPFHRPCKPSDATTFCTTFMEDIWPPPGLCIRVFIKSIGLETAAAMAPDVHPAAMLPAKEGLSLLMPKSPFTGPYKPSLTPALPAPLHFFASKYPSLPKKRHAHPLCGKTGLVSEGAIPDQGKTGSLLFAVLTRVKGSRTAGWQLQIHWLCRRPPQCRACSSERCPCLRFITCVDNSYCGATSLLCTAW